MNADATNGTGVDLTSYLRQAQRGDVAAFRKLCTPQSWERWVLTAACLLPARLRSKVDPEDVVLETLEQAWRNIGQFKVVSTGAFHRWVSVALDHKVKDVIKYFHRPGRDANRERSRPSATASVFVDHHTPSSSVVRRDQRKVILDLLNGLNHSYRDVIVYRFLEGLSAKEVAELMETSPGNIRVLLHRALRRFGEMLEERQIKSTLFRSR